MHTISSAALQRGKSRGPAVDVARLIGLLREAREHVTDKPWDDSSLLHARISEALGLPVEYPDMVEQFRAEQADDE